MSPVKRSLPLTPLLLPLLIGGACATPEPPGGAEPTELALGLPPPAFSLAGVDGDTHSLTDYQEAKAVLVVFTCLSCPFARAYEERIITLAHDYAERGVQVVAIMPNDPKIVPADATDKLKQRAEEMDYPFPYLIDETQGVATAFGARVTPHAFLFGPDQRLVYRGRIDDDADGAKVTRHDLRNALDAVLAGEEIPTASTKAFGCTIKWKQEKAD
jgi:peroxiredoxin